MSILGLEPNLIRTILISTVMMALIGTVLRLFFPKGCMDDEDDAPVIETACDPWSRIAAQIPGTANDMAVLREHWARIDKGLDVDGLTPEEDALRRVLHVDLPRIADALEGSMAVARDDRDRQVSGAHALASLERLLAILNAHADTVFTAACDGQATVGRYLEAKGQSVTPVGPLALLRPDAAGAPSPACVRATGFDDAGREALSRIARERIPVVHGRADVPMRTATVGCTDIPY